MSDMWTPTTRPGDLPEEVPLNEFIGQAVGAISMCWVGGTGALEFDSAKAARIVEAMNARIQTEIVRASQARKPVTDVGDHRLH